MAQAAGPSLHDVVSRPLTFNEMSRVQLVQKSHPNSSLLGIRDWALPALTAAQCLGALKVDLGLTKKEPQQRHHLQSGKP